LRADDVRWSFCSGHVLEKSSLTLPVNRR
jgi:hypothetical protein